MAPDLVSTHSKAATSARAAQVAGRSPARPRACGAHDHDRNCYRYHYQPEAIRSARSSVARLPRSTDGRRRYALLRASLHAEGASGRSTLACSSGPCRRSGRDRVGIPPTGGSESVVVALVEVAALLDPTNCSARDARAIRDRSLRVRQRL